MFTASTALLKIARTWKQSKCPSKDEWKKKKDEWINMWYTYKMEYYSFIKRSK